MTAINIPDSGMHKDDIFNNAIKLFRSNINKGSFMQMLEEMEFVKHSDDDRFFWSDNFGY